jgi:hypothetical protein
MPAFYGVLAQFARGNMLAFEDDRVFVMRFWREDEATESPPFMGWRARITCVNMSRPFYVYAPGIDEAFAIVRSLLLSGKHEA